MYVRKSPLYPTGHRSLKGHCKSREFVGSAVSYNYRSLGDRMLGREREERKKEPVAPGHQMVSSSLALLYLFFLIVFFSYLNGSRAAAPVGDEVL